MNLTKNLQYDLWKKKKKNQKKMPEAVPLTSLLPHVHAQLLLFFSFPHFVLSV